MKEDCMMLGESLCRLKMAGVVSSAPCRFFTPSVEGGFVSMTPTLLPCRASLLYLIHVHRKFKIKIIF